MNLSLKMLQIVFSKNTTRFAASTAETGKVDKIANEIEQLKEVLRETILDAKYEGRKIRQKVLAVKRLEEIRQELRLMVDGGS